VQQPGAPDLGSPEPALPASDGPSPASEEIRVAFG
jgi:3-oxoacyl-[acyl-carrier-protein] synthase-3